MKNKRTINIEKSELNWKQTYIVGGTIRLQNYYDKHIDEHIDKKPLIGLISAGMGVVWVITAVLLAQIIETPIRMLIFKGRLKDKLDFWFKCWQSAYEPIRDWRN